MLNKSKAKPNKSEDQSQDAFEVAADGDEDSFKLDLSKSASIKNPFGDAGDDDDEDNNSFNSKFINSAGDQDSYYVSNNSPLKKKKKEDKKETLTRNTSKNRKKWDKTNNSKNMTKKTKNQAKTNNDSGDSYGDDGDSSFLSDFDDLAKAQSKKKNKSIKHPLQDNKAAESKKYEERGTMFTFDAESDALLQYIHAVSWSLEDYLDD